jgi:ATP-dependent RNA helicase MSS116
MQMGIPADAAQYIHRLGRTARAGKEGCGVLMLADFEARFLGKLRDLPITEVPFFPHPRFVTHARTTDLSLLAM